MDPEATLSEPAERWAIAKPFLAVLGGWLVVMPASVLTIALRMREFDATGLPSFYSLTLALGWLTLIVSLLAFGAIGDRSRRRSGSRTAVVRIGALGIAVSGVLVALAPSPAALLAAWVLVQLPVAAVLSNALAQCGEVVPLNRQGIASGAIGAASIIALFAGSVLVNITASTLTVAFLIPALLGAALVVPLAFGNPDKTGDDSKPVPDAPASPGSYKLLVSAWVLFTVASLLLSWATSTTNGFIVLLVERIALVGAGSVASISASLISIATLCAIIGSLVIGPLARTRRSASLTWVVAAVACGAALAILMTWNTTAGLFLAAIVFGTAFGLANGVELSIVLSLRRGSPSLGRDMGLFTSATTLPYVLVPALAAIVLADSVAVGLRLLFWLACLMAFAAAALTFVMRMRTRQV